MHITWKSARLSIGLALLGALTLHAQSGPSSIGREVSVPTHLRDGQEHSLPLPPLLAHGQLLFNATWTVTNREVLAELRKLSREKGPAVLF